MTTEIRWEDNSVEAILQVALEAAPMVEEIAETIVEEIQASIDRGSPSGREYWLARGHDEKRSDWRAARREFEMETHRAKEAGLPGPKKKRRTLEGRTYTASAPGEPPAQPTQRYRNSWHATAAKRDGADVYASAFSKAKAANGANLARMLEYGTAKMRPRPHIRAALARAQTRVARLVAERSGA